MKRMIFSMVLIAGTVLSSPSFAQSAQSVHWVEDAMRQMVERGMTKQQIKAEFARHGVDLTVGTIDAVIDGAMGTNTNVTNQVVYALKTGDVSELQKYLVNFGYLVAEDLATQYMPSLVDLVKGGACSSLAMEAAGAWASGVAGVFTGGRATVVAQLAQQVQLIWANKCNAQMNDSLASLQEYERRNISNGAVNGAAGIDGMMSRTMPNLGSGGFLSNEAAIRNQYHMAFPDMFPPMTGDDLAAINRDITLRARQANMNEAALQNRSVQEGMGSLKRARDYAVLGREGPGIRSELQAGNAIQGEQLAALNSLTAATVGGQRAELERRLSDEAIKEASNARVDDYMANLGVCANCGINRAILE